MQAWADQSAVCQSVGHSDAGERRVDSHGPGMGFQLGNSWPCDLSQVPLYIGAQFTRLQGGTDLGCLGDLAG